MDSDTQELLPCPHCGSEAILNQRGTDWFVWCERRFDLDNLCPVNSRTRSGQTRQGAIDQWNARAFPSENDKKLLREIWEYFDNTGDGAPDSSYLERQNLNFSEPLQRLLERMK